MSMREQPCPYRIIDDCGGAFSMGCVAGCVAYFIKGMWFSPKSERFYGGIQLLKKRAPILGGSFAMWGGLFSLTECTLIHLRQKEDWINPVVGGFVSGGLLAGRAGPKIAFRNALFGGLILGCIQMVEVGMIKYQMRQQMKMQAEQQEMEAKQQLELLKERNPSMYAQIVMQKQKREEQKRQEESLKQNSGIFGSNNQQSIQNNQDGLQLKTY